MRTIKDCQEGDIIMDTTGSKCMVLGRLNTLIFRSEYSRYDISWYRPMTVQEAEKEGWKILTKEGKEPMTQKEAERLLGNVEII